MAFYYWYSTGWTVREANPCGARYSAPIQTCPGALSASYTMGVGSFPEVELPGRGVDHPLPSCAEVNERVVLYSYNESQRDALFLRFI